MQTNKNVKSPCSDEVLKAKTGRDWSQWRKRLDAEGAAALEHKKLAKLIGSMHSAGDWWSQTIAVGYERQRGKRSIHQRSDRSFTMSASKTLSVNAATAHAFFVEGKKRVRWLEEDIIIRTATAPKSVRITWLDETSVAVWITAKGEKKCTVAVEHAKLSSQPAVTSQKIFWKAALERLANVV